VCVFKLEKESAPNSSTSMDNQHRLRRTESGAEIYGQRNRQTNISPTGTQPPFGPGTPKAAKAKQMIAAARKISSSVIAITTPVGEQPVSQ
jgi:hypothetical protein